MSNDRDESNTENEERALAAAGHPSAVDERKERYAQGQKPEVEKAYADHRAGVAPKPGGSGDFSIGGKLWPGLSKLIEECGEVSQVAGKLIGSHGVEDHWDGTNLRQRLESEIGDLLAAIEFFSQNNHLDKRSILDRRSQKIAMFEEWHRSGQ